MDLLRSQGAWSTGDRSLWIWTWWDALCFCSVLAADNPWHNQVTETVKALGYSLCSPPHYSTALFRLRALKHALLSEVPPPSPSTLRWLYKLIYEVGGPPNTDTLVGSENNKTEGTGSGDLLLSLLAMQCRSVKKKITISWMKNFIFCLWSQNFSFNSCQKTF